MIALCLQLRPLWDRLKYGPALGALYQEIDFVFDIQNERNLLRLAQAGVAEARAELERRHHGVINNDAVVGGAAHILAQ